MPINTPIELSLTSIDGTEIYTKIFLTPHMYLEFQPARGKFLKNADAIRVETIYQLGYLEEDIFQAKDHIFLKKYTGEEKPFFTSVISDIRLQNNEVEKLLKEYRSYKVGKIPGYETIQKYVHLFVNEEKKKVFYKNLVLGNFVDLLSGDKYDETMVKNTQKNLEFLRSLDVTSYDEMFSLSTYFR